MEEWSVSISNAANFPKSKANWLTLTIGVVKFNGLLASVYLSKNQEEHFDVIN